MSKASFVGLYSGSGTFGSTGSSGHLSVDRFELVLGLSLSSSPPRAASAMLPTASTATATTATNHLIRTVSET